MPIYEVYWRNFVDIKIAEQYFSLYASHSKYHILVIDAICMIFSLTGIISLVNNYCPTVVSSLIILSSQIVSVLQPLYPYSQRLYAAQCIYREYSNLALITEQTVNGYLYGNIEESDLLPALERAQSESNDIENKFCSVDLFPKNIRLHKAAEKSVMQYLNVHFDLGEKQHEK